MEGLLSKLPFLLHVPGVLNRNSKPKICRYDKSSLSSYFGKRCRASKSIKLLSDSLSITKVAKPDMLSLNLDSV